MITNEILILIIITIPSVKTMANNKIKRTKNNKSNCNNMSTTNNNNL